MPTQQTYQFRPVQGTDDSIQAMPYCEGYVYFATDTGRMYLDAEGIAKIPLGGGGAAVLYANSTSVTERADGSWTMPYNDLEDETAVPKETDLIINIDGSFYKVISADKDSNIIHCNRIAVSGTGGGGGGSTGGGGGTGTDTNAFVIKLADGSKFPTTFIYGQSYEVTFDVNAPSDEQVIVTFTVQSSDINAQPKLYPVTCKGKGKCTFDIGAVLPAETGLAIKVQANGDNDGISNALYYRQRSVIEMSLQESQSFNPRNVATGVLQFKCIPVGVGLSKTLKIFIDDIEQKSLEKTPIYTSGQEVTVDIPMQTHGYHKVTAVLSAETGLGSAEADPLNYELAWDAGEGIPIIWLGKYPTEIKNHDKLLLEYMVYDPNSLTSTAKVQRYLNNNALPEVEVAYDRTKWEPWNVVDYVLGNNKIIIDCNGQGTRTIDIVVNEDMDRLDFNVITSGLLLNLDSKGRSNKENITSRQTWNYTDANGNKTAVAFNGFNWFSNGWVSDDDNNSCLRISNGASITVPLEVLEDQYLENPLTFEFVFKLRNVQDLSTLVTTSSEEVDGKVVITKTVQTETSVFAKYFNNDIGLCLGTQEAFFKTGSNAIVNARYGDNDLVHLSFVIQNSGNQPLIYIYLNGINSGVVSYISSNDNFGAQAKAITFNSTYCDIDLYKVRVYNSQLSSIDIVRNYVADLNSTELYDMNQICSFVNNIPRVEYSKILTYNSNYPDNQTIPYAVVEVSGDTTDERLPYVKGGDRDLDVTFINPALDRAYEQGLLTDEEYITGCPSFKATVVPFDVQGTSSQGYPRRNFKGKFKKGATWVYLNGPLAGKSLLEKNTIEGSTKEYKHYYMDNKDASESTFTWKADYMESSGTHNTGFASFVKTLYSHHPLVDYDPNYVTGDHRTTVYGFPMMVFQKYKDGTYEFVGKYNFNLDKGCNNVIDFENESAHPFVEGKTYKDIAQCWEFCNNQHTRCSFKEVDFAKTYPTGHEKAGKLTVLDDFEYRYNHNEDKMDAAIDGDTTVFPTQASANEYLLSEYAELEKVALWLDSTNVEKATNATFETPVIFGEGASQESFEADTAEYRLAKFRYEFTKHFNPEYCYVYFIMTELLLQYDSRGKNCMFASWGPQEVGGEYIWYPIFYDIDTQLGVNNSGVPTWEYPTEATRDNQFSTPDSILWNNLWSCFSTPIKNTYIALRKKEQGLTIEDLNGYYDFDFNISHSYAMKGTKPINMINVDEYYKYIAPAFTGYIDTSGNTARTSLYFYCLQGTRELHRKQFLRNRFNYIDSQWLGGPYDVNAVLQELKIRYNTSEPLGTSDKFISKQPAVANEKWEAFVANGGQVQEYKKSPLDGDVDFVITPYLKQYVSMYFDETPSAVQYFDGTNPVTLKPSESIQRAIEEDPSVTQQLLYFGGVEYISKFGDLSLKYVNEFAMNKAIRLKELYLGNETAGYYNNLLSDSFFDMAASKTVVNDEGLTVENPYGKPLLETVVLTNIGSLVSSQDLTSCEKLRTFRALGTGIGGVTLAEGVPIETLYLPSSITYFSLTEPTDLKNLLTAKPVADSNGDFPKGLYIEGITNKVGTTIAADDKIKLFQLDLSGGNMGYDSYKLAKTIVDIKTKMHANADLDSTYNKNLYVNLKDINWTPYRLVESGESIINGATYVKKTDHYTFENYNPGSTWEVDTLNGKVYQVDTDVLTSDSGSITSFEMLDTFINSTKTEENYFRYITGKKGTLAHVSGNIFIKNTGNAIKESDIKNYYNKHYPDLNIFVSDVIKSYTAKFIEVMDSGQEYEWGVLKFDPDETAYPRLPVESDGIKPSKLHKTFKGWVASPTSTTVLTDDDMKNYPFSDTNSVYTFYAFYEDSTFSHKFYNQGAHILTADKAYNEYLDEPSTMPAADASGIAFDQKYTFVGWTEDADKGATGILSANEIAEYVVDVSSYISVRPYTFYACYVLEDVHETATDPKFLRFEPIGDGETYAVGPSLYYNLKGKITLPVVTPTGALDGAGNPVTAGKPVAALLPGSGSGSGDANFSNNDELTHVFWQGGAEAQTYMTEIADYAFYDDEQLVYFEFPVNITRIGEAAFYSCKEITFGDGENQLANKVPDGVTSIGPFAFKYALNSINNGTLILPGSLAKFETYKDNGVDISQAFEYLERVSALEIGAMDSPTNLTLAELADTQQIFLQADRSDITLISKVTVYVDSSQDANAWAELAAKLRIGYWIEDEAGERVFTPITADVVVATGSAV